MFLESKNIGRDFPHDSALIGSIIKRTDRASSDGFAVIESYDQIGNMSLIDWIKFRERARSRHGRPFEI